MRILTVLFGILLTAACTSKHLEIYTTGVVEVYSQPNRPEIAGNRKLGSLPPMTTLPVKDEVLGKDFAAYEIEFTGGNASVPTKGFVLLGTSGLHVREARR
jgi:hypothetical protein